MAIGTDETVMELADESGRLIVSSDTDFVELFARSNASSPSVLAFRREGQPRTAEVAALWVRKPRSSAT
jgi:predicted nuclease of predicted toxin-antitoxin system